MKPKKLFLAFLFLFLLFSCEKSDEINTMQITTDIVVDISVSSEIWNSPLLKSKSDEIGYSFSGTGIFCLASNKDLGKTACEIQSVEPGTNCILTISGVTDETKIFCLLLRWDSKPKDSEDFDMQKEIDITSLVKNPENGSFVIDLTNTIIPLVNCFDTNPECMYRIDVVGSSDSNISTTAKLKIPLIVETKVYTTRFSLY